MTKMTTIQTRLHSFECCTSCAFVLNVSFPDYSDYSNCNTSLSAIATLSKSNYGSTVPMVRRPHLWYLCIQGANETADMHFESHFYASSWGAKEVGWLACPELGSNIHVTILNFAGEPPAIASNIMYPFLWVKFNILILWLVKPIFQKSNKSIVLFWSINIALPSGNLT